MPQADRMLREAIIRLARFPCQLEGPGLGADVLWRWYIWFSVGRVCRSHLSSGPLLVSSKCSAPTSCLRTCSHVRHPGMGERNIPWGGSSRPPPPRPSILWPSDNANSLLNVVEVWWHRSRWWWHRPPSHSSPKLSSASVYRISLQITCPLEATDDQL